MVRVYVATLANFFFPGLGWIVLGRAIPLGIALVQGAVGLTYVETSLQAAAPALYWPMFASVFVINTALAVDTYLWGAARAAR